MKNVLEIMKSVDQWHLWRLEDGRKIPYQIDMVRKAKSNDPDTWASYDDALAALPVDDTSWNMAFTLGERGLFTGVDFDDAYEWNEREPMTFEEFRSDDPLMRRGQARPWAVRIFDTIKDRCYAEVSPSGTGLKAIIIGQKPDGARCSKSMGDGKQAIEIYDHNRFWAFTGETLVDGMSNSAVFDVNYDVVQEAGLIEQAVQQEIPVVVAPQGLRTSSRASQFSAGETALYRAEKYADAVDRNTNQRNNVVFGLSGNLRGINGISEDQMLSIVRRVNSEFVKGPLSDQEVRTAFWSSGANGTARENKGVNKEFVAEAQVDSKALQAWDGLLDEKYINDVPERSEALYSASDASNQLPDDLMRDGGFIQGFMEWVEGHQRYRQPEMAFAAALHVASVAISRRFKDDSVFSTTPNMYSMVLAGSGTGKDLPRRKINDFLNLMNFADVCGPSVIDSGAGLATSLVSKPSMSMLLDECGDLFSNLASDRCPAHFKKVGLVLKTLYSSAGSQNIQLRALANNDAGQNDPVDFPHLNIMATATERQVLQSVSDNQIEDGLMGRFSLFFGTNEPSKQRARASEPSQSIREWFIRWADVKVKDALDVDFQVDGNKSITLEVIRRTDEAADRLDEHYDAISDRQIEKQRKGASLPEQTIWARASEKTAKLALLFAVSRGSSTIELVDADRAIAVNNFLTRRVVKVYENRTKTDYQEKRTRVLRTINTNFTTVAAVFRMNSDIDPQLRVKIINDLIDSQEIHEVKKGVKTYYVKGKSPV